MTNRESRPDLVSIGVPVRNGGDMLEEALECLVRQTHRNLEIVISDNNSDDGTAEICAHFSARDQRIRYVRQTETLGAAENFRRVLEYSAGNYFMWAAHDDRRSDNYVEVLLEALIAHPGAPLAFSDVAVFNENESWREIAGRHYDVDFGRFTGFYARAFRKTYIKSGYLHLYGLIRSEALRGYEWPDIEIGPDRPLLFFLSCRGRFIASPGACFYCFKPEKGKSQSFRARETYRKSVRPFPYVRLSWSCAKAGTLGERLEGRTRSVAAAFLACWAAELSKQANRNTRRILRSMWRPLRGA